MAGKSTLDNYDQYAVFSVAGIAAAAGFVVSRLVTGITNLQKIGWAISALDYTIPEAWFVSIREGNDFLRLAVSMSMDLNLDVEMPNPSVIDMMELVCSQTPAAQGGPFLHQMPFSHRFMPGHEILALPQNVNAALQWDCTGNLSVADAYIRVWYKEVELGTEDWYDLLQLRLPLGI